MICHSILRGAFLILLTATISSAFAQSTPSGAVRGKIVSEETSEPVPGASVSIRETGRGTATDQDGTYLIENIPAGDFHLQVQHLGHEKQERHFSVRDGETTVVDIVLRERAIEVSKAIVVTATREEQAKADVPATISTIGAEEIKQIRPSHPAEVMGLVPGAWVNVTGGEGHMTAIRQPLTTNPVYLYLEDGIPSRSTGFFNHNALYEINVPMSGGIEVSKGPGSALYGSDAIGGVINVLTSPGLAAPEATATIEGGSFGWKRALVTGGSGFGDHRLRADLNLTMSDGWRDATDYERQSGTVRWDYSSSSRTVVKTVATYSHIDQNTAGSSAISYDDYINNPTINYTPISLRKVEALRISTAIEHQWASSLVSVTPYFRFDSMDLLPNWSLSYDPTIYNTKNTSYGLAAKYRVDITPLSTRLITGVDVDYSPGSKLENRLSVTREGKIYTSYTIEEEIYNYDVRFQEAAPYLQLESSVTNDLKVTGGIRFDFAGYNYETHLAAVDTGNWRVPQSTTTSYSHVSPKIGATFNIIENLNAFAAYNHGFRVPSEGQLFRQGSSVNTVDLKPVKVDNYEAGLRGRIADPVTFDLSVYTMTKKDDILTYVNPSNGLREAVNAGETNHWGIEIGIGARLMTALKMDVAFSHGRHTYEDWVLSSGVNYSGKEMEIAPRDIGNVRVAYAPEIGHIALEMVYLGSYWMDPANTHKYAGHTLFNMDVGAAVFGSLELSLKVRNMLDRRYAESTGYTSFRGEEFAPGNPRTFIGGVSYTLK